MGATAKLNIDPAHGEGDSTAKSEGPRLAPPTPYYAQMGIDISWTGDLAVTEDMHLPPMRTDDETGSLEPENTGRSRRGFERYNLEQNFIRATVRQGSEPSGESGRVTNASVTGLWIETSQPLPFRTDVDVDWCVMGSFSMRFPGRVVRCTDTGMAVVLDVDDSSWRFRSSFVDLARTPTDEPPTVIVQKREGNSHAVPQPNDALLLGLAEQWQRMEKNLDDDKAHQEFINACLNAKRLEYALERYRELKLHNPNSPVATRYLKQIGTILTFYTLNKDPEDTSPPWWKKTGALIVLLLVAAVGSLTLAERLTQSKLQLESTTTAPPSLSR